MKTPWWQSDTYDVSDPCPESFNELAGPEGLALVRAWPDGRTDSGWGLVGKGGDPALGFWERYNKGEFNARRVLYGFGKGKHAFAFVMRSTRVVCVDIDGKNGGFEHVKRLGALPPTLAETSKSGNGYHLFYELEQDWEPLVGYGSVRDRIGLEQGVDIRATGCVYHHEQQRWNSRRLAKLPAHLLDALTAREMKVAASKARLSSVLSGDDELEILMLKTELESELKKPIPEGKRNNTLFAIGSQLAEAGVDDWENKLEQRALDLGLGLDEAAKLVENVTRYATPVAP